MAHGGISREVTGDVCAFSAVIRCDRTRTVRANEAQGPEWEKVSEHDRDAEVDKSWRSREIEMGM